MRGARNRTSDRTNELILIQVKAIQTDPFTDNPKTS